MCSLKMLSPIIGKLRSDPHSLTLRFIFLTNVKYFGIFRLIPVFETTAIIKTCKFTVFSSGSFCQIYRVTDEALIAETMVWPNFFLMNVFFALKGSKPFFIISYHCSWVLCRVAAVKSLPALIYSADVYFTFGPIGRVTIRAKKIG